MNLTKLEESYKNILDNINEDPKREGLKNTPKRAAESISFLCKGYNDKLEEITKNALFHTPSNEMVIVKNIELYSLCEHHILPFVGKANIGYIPNGKVLGLSKFAMIVDMFSRRLQIQEQLTQQIADAVLEVTNAKGVAVIIEAEHMCIKMIGVEKQNSSLVTSVMLGSFRSNHATRAEFLNLIKNS